ncbi:PASTA domain-containing protein [Nocardia sp. NPDC050793]|uniref:PASTA domain-containing protein n=1 Tax=Nocardia sp. NPDC050793 TaxID=3155159 RepID=UPI0033FC7132
MTPPEVGSGGAGNFTFRRIDTTSDLETELGIDAELSAGVGPFSVDASFNFAKRCRIQSSSLSVLVSAEERFAFRQMDSPELSPAAADLVRQGNTDLFADRFGEYFVRGIRTGGRFFGVVRIDTKSTESKLAVDAALSGSYGTLSAEVRVKVTETLRTAQARVEVFLMFEGGRVATRPTSNDPIELLSQLYKAMDEWTATVQGAPQPYAATLAPYVIALGPLPPNVAEIEHQRDVLKRCAKLRSQTIDKLNLVDYILDPRHTSEFDIVPPPEGPDLSALQATLANDLDVIGDAASFSIDNVDQACDPETFMRTIKGVADFRLTALPTNMPKHSRGPKVQIPPWNTLQGALEGESAFFPPDMVERFMPSASSLGLRLNVVQVGPLSPDDRGGLVVRTIPPAESMVPVGSVVTIEVSSPA